MIFTYQLSFLYILQVASVQYRAVYVIYRSVLYWGSVSSVNPHITENGRARDFSQRLRHYDALRHEYDVIACVKDTTAYLVLRYPSAFQTTVIRLY